MVARTDYTAAQRGRLEALEWAEHMMADLHTVVTRDPADRQARRDASLILSAVDELTTGREPKTIPCSRRRMSRTPTPEERQRLWRVRELRQRIPRQPVTRRRKQAVAGQEGGQADRIWSQLANLAGLDSRETKAIRLQAGRGRSLREVARALGVSRRQADQISADARRKLEWYIGSRQLRSVDELLTVL